MKKIGIYNPYLETKGGGEKVCLAIAEVLSQTPDTSVELITHGDVDLKELERYFSVDLSKVKLTKLDFTTIYARITSRIPFLPGSIRTILHDIKVKHDLKALNYDVFINNCYQSNLPGAGKQNVYMCMFPQRLSHYGSLGLARRLYRPIIMALNRLVLYPTKRHAVYTYDLVTANSKYTKHYIKEYWGLDSIVLYPICDDMYDKKLNNKRKVILNVGRFFENIKGSHHKRQDVLVKTFVDMPELHKGGWELHLAGSVAEDVGGLKYILSLIKMSKGFPVYFHFNCSYLELKNLYNEASIYWHATGFGSSSNKNPETQEHFGITTVEAMSAGAIPVVINTAGQKEVVKDGQNGYLWNDLKQLKDKTLHITNNDIQDITDIRKRVTKTHEQFSYKPFKESVLKIFTNL